MARLNILFVLALGLVLCLSLALAGERGEKPRDKKVLSLFNVVKFENSPCTSNAKTGSGSNRNGTCFTASECNLIRGTHGGNCAAGFGVCCVFTIENSGDSINQNCSYLRNPGFPATYSGTETSFRNTINKCRCDICAIRLDFEAFTTLGPADTLETGGGACVDTFTVTTSTSQKIPVICGSNSGKHMYIETGSGCSDSVDIASAFTGASTIRRWDIKATQIECSNALLPPQGCLEYLTSSVGRITSFNFENTAETHLANQEHKICVRSNSNSCCIRYTLCDDPLAFSLFHKAATLAATMSMSSSECSEDYIEAQDFSTDCFPRGPSVSAYRLCGGKFNTVLGAVDAQAICDCNPDFSLLIRTDGDTDIADPSTVIAPMPNLVDRSKGICLDYSLINC